VVHQEAAKRQSIRKACTKKNVGVLRNKGIPDVKVHINILARSPKYKL